MKTWLTLLTIAVALLLLGGCHGAINPDAENALRSELGHTTFTVFPTFVRSGDRRFDQGSARGLIKLIEDEKLGTAVFRDEAIDFPGTWHMNQARMFRESFDAIRLHLQNHPIETRFAVVAEYLIGQDREGGPRALGIHAYVLDHGGRPAAGVLMNSHNRGFAQAAPKTAEDCTQVLMNGVRNELLKLRDSPTPEVK